VTPSVTTPGDTNLSDAAGEDVHFCTHFPRNHNQPDYEHLSIEMETRTTATITIYMFLSHHKIER